MELTIRACEGGFYLADLNLDHNGQKANDVCAKHGIKYKDNMRFDNLALIREHFDPISPANVWLVQNVAYDEMIGLSEDIGEHKQPLHWYQ